MSDCGPFSIRKTPTPRDAHWPAIWTAIDRLQEFPNLGMPTEDSDIRQIVVRFGSSGYIVRYAALSGDENILITRIWHGREARS